MVDGCPLLLRHLQGGRRLLFPLPATPISCKVENIYRDGNTVYQMDVGYWNIDELPALSIQLIYVHILSLHSLACINSGAEFESLLCFINAHMLL